MASEQSDQEVTKAGKETAGRVEEAYKKGGTEEATKTFSDQFVSYVRDQKLTGPQIDQYWNSVTSNITDQKLLGQMSLVFNKGQTDGDGGIATRSQDGKPMAIQRDRLDGDVTRRQDKEDTYQPTLRGMDAGSAKTYAENALALRMERTLQTNFREFGGLNNGRTEVMPMSVINDRLDAIKHTDTVRQQVVADRAAVAGSDMTKALQGKDKGGTTLQDYISSLPPTFERGHDARSNPQADGAMTRERLQSYLNMGSRLQGKDEHFTPENMAAMQKVLDNWDGPKDKNNPLDKQAAHTVSLLRGGSMADGEWKIWGSGKYEGPSGITYRPGEGPITAESMTKAIKGDQPAVAAEKTEPAATAAVPKALDQAQANNAMHALRENPQLREALFGPQQNGGDAFGQTTTKAKIDEYLKSDKSKDLTVQQRQALEGLSAGWPNGDKPMNYADLIKASGQGDVRTPEGAKKFGDANSGWDQSMKREATERVADYKGISPKGLESVSDAQGINIEKAKAKLRDDEAFRKSPDGEKIRNLLDSQRRISTDGQHITAADMAALQKRTGVTEAAQTRPPTEAAQRPGAMTPQQLEQAYKNATKSEGVMEVKRNQPLYAMAEGALKARGQQVTPQETRNEIVRIAERNNWVKRADQPMTEDEKRTRAQWDAYAKDGKTSHLPKDLNARMREGVKIAGQTFTELSPEQKQARIDRELSKGMPPQEVKPEQVGLKPEQLQAIQQYMKQRNIPENRLGEVLANTRPEEAKDSLKLTPEQVAKWTEARKAMETKQAEELVARRKQYEEWYKQYVARAEQIRT